MRFRNSFRILVDNFSNVYKLLLFRLVTNALTLSLMYVIVSFGLHVIFSSAEAREIVTLAGEFFEALISGNVGFLGGFQEAFTAAIANFLYLLGSNIGSIVGSVIGVVLLYLVARFLNGTSLFAAATILNGKMEFYGKTGFSSAYFRNIGKATLYHALYVPLSFVYDILCILGCWFFFFFTPSFLPNWGIVNVLIGLALSMAAFIGLQAIKLAFVSAWIPSIVAGGSSVVAGMKESFRSMHGFLGRLSCYFVSIYLIVVLNAVFAVCTFGSFLLLTVPASYLFVLALQFVHYYEDHEKKYFLSFRKISGADGKPDSMGD